MIKYIMCRIFKFYLERLENPMVVFLYIGIIVGFIVASIIFNKQSKSMMKKKKSAMDGEKVRISLGKFILGDILIGAIIMVIVSFLIPLAIWTTGSKELREVEMITLENEIKPFQDGSYIKEEKNDNGEVLIISEKGNKNDYERYYSRDKVEVIKGAKSGKFQEVLLYKIECLDSSNIINRLVNDTFANIYMESSEAQFIKKKVKIYVP